MPFTAQEAEHIANTVLDFHMDEGNVHSQTIQAKPLLRDMMSMQKTFPGGEQIDVRVKGEYSSDIEGFEGDDEVTFVNPANVKKAFYPWKQLHTGIKVTMSELLKGGISITDTTHGKGETNHTQQEKIALVNLLTDKLEDMSEGSSRGRNRMLWRDGTQDVKLVPGVRSFVVNDPTAATVVGGIDQQANTWWRNRATLAITASTATDQNVVNTLQAEFRQLRRYGAPKHKVYCGSDWLTWMEKELRAKGNYTDTGWAGKGRLDPSMDDLSFKGVPFEYDPTLDDEGLGKFCFAIDTKSIFPMVIDGEDGKKHYPARPAERFVLYRSMTWAMGLACRQRNTSGVYSIA